MGKPYIPLCWLVEEEGDHGEIILTGRLGRGQLVGRLIEHDDGTRLWAIALTEKESAVESRKHYAKRKRGGDA